jgi:Tfp pilus assembly protein PilN
MRGKKRTVGLSIGSQKITLAEVSINTAGSVEVKHLGIANIPNEAIYRGNISDTGAALESLREVLSVINVGNTPLSLSIEDETTNSRLMMMPSLSRSEIFQSLTGEVEDYAILAGTKPALDYQIIRQISVGGNERIQVLFVVAPIDLVNSYLSLANSANLKLTSIETIPLSVLRTFINVIQPEQSDKPVMLVVVEDNHGMLIVLHNKTVRFIHDIEIGSIELISHLDIDELGREISQSLDYFRDTFPTEGAIEEIVLVADGLENTDILSRLTDTLKISVNEPQLPAEVLGEFSGKIEGNKLSICAAIGSALYKAIGKGELTINLIPSKKDAKKSPSRTKVAVLTAILIFVVSAFVVASFATKSMTNSVEQKITALQQQSVVESSDPAELKALEDSIAQLKARIQVTDVAMNSIKWANCARFLEEIRVLAPSTIWLNRLTWNEDQSATITGYALSYDAVFKFRRALIESPYFDPIKIVNIQDTDMLGQTVEQFQINCGVKREVMGGGKK